MPKFAAPGAEAPSDRGSRTSNGGAGGRDAEKGGGEPGFYYSGVRFRDLTPADIKGLESYLAHFRRGPNPA